MLTRKCVDEEFLAHLQGEPEGARRFRDCTFHGAQKVLLPQVFRNSFVIR